MQEDADLAARYVAAGSEGQEIEMNMDQYSIVEDRKAEGWQRVVKNAPDISSLWGFLANAEYRMGGHARRKIKVHEPNQILELYNQRAVTAKEKCNLLATHYASRGNAFSQPLGNKEKDLLENSAPPEAVTAEEVADALRQVNK